MNIKTSILVVFFVLLSGQNFSCSPRIANISQDPVNKDSNHFQYTLYTIQRTGVWKVFPNGDVELVPMNYEKHWPAEFHISPDQKYIAFKPKAAQVLEDGSDLWLYDLSSAQETQISHLGASVDGKFSAIIVDFMGWSADSKMILGKVYPSQEFGRGSGTELRPNAPNGYFIYDLAKRQLSTVEQSDFIQFQHDFSSNIAYVKGDKDELVIINPGTGQEIKRHKLARWLQHPWSAPK